MAFRFQTTYEELKLFQTINQPNRKRFGFQTTYEELKLGHLAESALTG